MRAVVWRGKRRVRVEEIPEPELVEPTDVIVRVTSTAVCGSDLLLYEGRLRRIEVGDVLGHAATGVVVQAGIESEHVEAGDRVVVTLVDGCGRPGGGQAGCVRVRHDQVVRVPQELPDRTYLFLSDVIPAAWAAAADPGAAVAVFGLGPAGQMAVRAARLRGCERVIGVDVVPERLDMARRHGAEVVSLDQEKDAVTAIRDRTRGAGVDSAIDCVGIAARRRGHVLDDARAVARSVRVVGDGAADPRPLAEELLPLVMRDDDPFGLNDFVTHHVSMIEAPYVYELLHLKKDGAITVVFEP
jgi:threonine dehydrogenase-like Zn-dependent dehydrogenase